ncbi:sensor histidine kinase [Tamlana sp. 2201CG12-4]|nr:sensor histidine kinase [Tamlana sp. 2201CG12-4]
MNDIIINLVIWIVSFLYAYTRERINEKDSKLKSKESELQLLKSQVNPHFLFNTLNTLYSTALEENASRTAESTAKLANLIRYMQEDIIKDFIPLENEVKYLQDYIVIQKLRCAIIPEIDLQFSKIENHNISPGLFIPFVENAFKYGIDPSKPSKLSVSVNCIENIINFRCVNSYDENFKTYYKERGFGIGIKNAKERLELVYPKKHTLEVKKEKNMFLVKLSINIAE